MAGHVGQRELKFAVAGVLAFPALARIVISDQVVHDFAGFRAVCYGNVLSCYCEHHAKFKLWPGLICALFCTEALWDASSALPFLIIRFAGWLRSGFISRRARFGVQ